MNIVEQWFGGAFGDLDPMLQSLHRSGCSLSGVIDVEYGVGLAQFIGARLAKKMGIPKHAGRHKMHVSISSTQTELIWRRDFETGKKMVSVFTARGGYPTGVWIETTGLLKLELGVKVIDGGWYWEPRRSKLGKFTLPKWLMPVSHAYKRVVDGEYEFSVAVTFPMVGMLFRYSGRLKNSE